MLLQNTRGNFAPTAFVLYYNRWDSIFVPDGSDDRPFSLMTTEEKNVLSHRGKAVRKWANWLGRNRQALYERQQGKQSPGHKGLDFHIDFSEQ